MELNVGNIVQIKVPVQIYEKRTVDDEKFFVVEAATKYDLKRKKQQPPYRVYESITGMYLGSVRKRMRDRRAARGVVRHLYQHFIFGEHEVMVDPSCVDTVFTVDDIMNVEDELATES